MNNLVLSEQTRQNVEVFLGSPSHAVLIIGASGSGKLTLAKTIASKILSDTDVEKLSQNSYFKVISPIEKTISINEIRELKNFFKLKTTGSNEIRRVVILENANYMTDEAQNAVLKILEEPPSDSIIIMTSPSEKSLNKTIVSRVQLIRIYKPTLEVVISFFQKKSYEIDVIQKNYILSNGSMGLLSSLLSESPTSEILDYVSDAKKLLVSSRLDKLLKADELSSNKNELTDRFFALKRVCHSALAQSIIKDQQGTTRQWLEKLAYLEDSENALRDGANTKLLLTSLFAKL